MTLFDSILLIILLAFVLYGFFFGLIRVLGGILGIFIGAWGASHFYLSFFSLIQGVFLGFDNLGKVVSFFILFGIINRLTIVVFAILDKTFDIISIIPFLSTINRLAGAFLGFLEGGLIIGLVLYVISRYTLLNTFLGDNLVNSQVAPYLLKFVTLLLPFLSEVLTKMQSLI